MSYLLIFGICFLFFLLAEKALQKKQYFRHFVVYSTIGISILCLFAGARDYTIGVDVIHYVYPAYKDALLVDFQTYLSVYTKEQLYYIIAYFSSRIGSGMFFLLFINEAIIVLPLAIAFYKLKDRFSYSFAMLMYMLLFYNFSLCYMRQFCAISILVLVSVLLREQNYRWSIILCIIAFFFHSSSIIISVALFVVKFLKKWYQMALAIFVFLAALLLSTRLLPVLMTLGVIPSEYVERFYATMTSGGINIGELALYSIIYFVPICLSFRYMKRNDLVNYYKACSFIGWIMILASSLISIYFYRLTFYFRFFALITLANSTKETVVKGKVNRMLLYAFVLLICLVHWWWFTIYINLEQTYPYMFQIGR